MWVEINCLLIIFSAISVILFVRMWVEIIAISVIFLPCTRHPLREDVSWNIVTSAEWRGDKSHPLREDVSWNNVSGMNGSLWFCHPLREDVSWNGNSYDLNDKENGHPLREDVSWNDVGYGRVGASCRHPPREDVGWNLEEYGVNHRCSNMVFLVGRWIEISLIVFLSFARRSHYYTSFNLNIKLNYRNLRGNFYMCS